MKTNILFLLYYGCIAVTLQLQAAPQHTNPPPQASPFNPKKAWQQTLSFITLEQTISAFPYLKKNTKATIITELFEAGACHHSHYKLQSMRFAIIDNKAYSFGNHGSKKNIGDRVWIYRDHFLNVITKRVRMPDLYFVLHIEDQLKEELTDRAKRHVCKAMPMFVFNKNSSSTFDRDKFLLPDSYVLYLWQRSINETKTASKIYQWKEKTSKLFFRGAPSAPHFFDVKLNQNVDLMKYYHRGGLVMLSAEHPDKIDAKFLEQPNSLTDMVQKKVGKEKKIFSEMVSLTDQIKYRYMASADGYAAAWKRIAWILFSNSILFKTQSEWIQWFYDKMVPDEHFVLVKDDLSNIFEKMQELDNDDAKALKMIERANALAQQHLTPEAIQNYGVDVLKKYAQYQQLNLSKEEKERIKNGTDIQDILKEQRKRELEEMDRLHMESWTSRKEFVEIDSIMGKFDFLKDNMGVDKIESIAEVGECGNWIRVLVLDGQAYFEAAKEDEDNGKVLTDFLNGISKENKLPDAYFLVANQLHPSSNNKCRQLPAFVTIKNASSLYEQTKFLLPDFSFLSGWPEKIEKIKQESGKSEWDKKTSKAYFRGEAPTENNKESQVEINGETDLYRLYHRAGFVLLSDERPDLIDAKFTPPTALTFQSLYKEMERRLGKEAILDSQVHQLPIDLNYRYQLTADGASSCQRIPLILHSNSVLMRPPSEMLQWYDDKLAPQKHYISLSDDLSNLVSKLWQLNANDSAIAGIVKEANQLAEDVLSLKGIEKHVRELMQSYSAYQNLSANLKVSNEGRELLKKGEKISQVFKYQKQRPLRRKQREHELTQLIKQHSQTQPQQPTPSSPLQNPLNSTEIQSPHSDPNTGLSATAFFFFLLKIIIVGSVFYFCVKYVVMDCLGIRPMYRQVSFEEKEEKQEKGRQRARDKDKDKDKDKEEKALVREEFHQ